MTTLVLSNYAGNLALAKLLNASGLYLAAHTDNPTPVGSAQLATEVSGGGYERQPVSFHAPSGRAIANAVKCYFSGMPNVIVKYLAVWDSAGEGNMICALLLSPSITVLDDGQLRVEAGDYAVQF